MKHLLLPLAALLATGPGRAAGPPPAITLPGYWACQQALLASGQAALGCYAPTQRDCQRGPLVLAYERRVSKPAEKARFQIADTVRLLHHAPHDYLTIATCTDAAGRAQQYFVLAGPESAAHKYFGRVRRVWGVSPQGQLVALPPGTLHCLNDAAGAD